MRLADFKIPEELDDYKESLRKFARTYLDQLAERIDREGRSVDEVRPILREAGIPQIACPREYGGRGLSMSQWWPVLEILASVGGVIRGIAHGGSAFWRMIYNHGSEEQKREYLIPFISGEKVGAFALTEPGCGTGIDIRTTARKRGDHFILNGRKHLITSAIALPRVAHFYHVVAYSKERSLGSRGISLFLVDRNSPGLTYEIMPDFMGLRGCPHLVLSLQDCTVPAKNLLGEEGEGLEIATKTFLTPSRWSIAVCCLGLAQRLLDLSIQYSTQRITFGKPIAKRQAVQQKLADMATDTYALRTMVSDIGQKLDDGAACSKEAAMCKNFGIDVTRRVSDAALEIHGGLGVCRAYPVERLYREARMLWFEEGTPTIQRLIIAQEILRRHAADSS